MRLPDRLQPGGVMDMAEADVCRVLDAHATRSTILNRPGDMVVTKTIEPFRVPRRRQNYSAVVHALPCAQPLARQ